GVKGLDNSLATLSRVVPKAKILVTLGSRGAALYSAGKLSKVRRISLEKLGRKVVNTTGSGDAFVGAFSAYKVLGSDDMTAFRYANMAGALKACHAETRTRSHFEEQGSFSTRLSNSAKAAERLSPEAGNRRLC